MPTLTFGGTRNIASLWCVWVSKQEKGTKLDHMIKVMSDINANFSLNTFNIAFKLTKFGWLVGIC